MIQCSKISSDIELCSVLKQQQVVRTFLHGRIEAVEVAEEVERRQQLVGEALQHDNDLRLAVGGESARARDPALHPDAAGEAEAGRQDVKMTRQGEAHASLAGLGVTGLGQAELRSHFDHVGLHLELEFCGGEGFVW